MKTVTSIIAAACLGTAALAQDDMIDSAQRTAAIDELGRLIADQYYDAEAGARIQDTLLSFAETREAGEIGHGGELAAVLTERLQALDRHFDIQWRGVEEIARTRAEWAQADVASAETEAEPDPDRWASLRRRNFAFADVSVLDGNIGYLNLTGFAPIEVAEPTAHAALDFIAHTDSVIIDLRENGGGAPDMVQYLLSHFLPEGEALHYNTFRTRAGEVMDMRTLPRHPAGHRPEVPLYILASPDTLSAAEALAYHLQAMGRAVIVGDVTAGGGNPGDFFLASTGYSIFIPTATSISPFTGTNWDGTGVVPDIEIDADDAMDRGLFEIYQRIVETSDDGNAAMIADWLLAPLSARFSPWTPDTHALMAFVGQYGPRRVWLEGERLMYQRDDRDPTELLPIMPGTFRFADSEDYLIDFLGYETGRAEALALRVEGGMTAPAPRSD